MKENLQFKSCLIGMLLGDGSIEKVSSQGARYTMIHSIKQKEYLEYKVKILEQLTSVNTYEYTDKRGFTYVGAKTRNHPYYFKLREQMYFNGRKTITSHLMKILDMKGIAIWFLDDGYIDRNMAQLATNCFTEAENYFLKDWLLKQHNIHSSVNRIRKYYFLKISAKDTERIVNSVKELNIPSMNYKILSYEKHLQPSYKDDSGKYKPGHYNQDRWKVDDIV